MNKYAAGGKCGSMSSSSAGGYASAGTLNIAALMAQREKDDIFFSSSAAPAKDAKDAKAAPAASSAHQTSLVIKKKYNQSDIDIILGGD
jgi:hypothetical protein